MELGLSGLESSPFTSRLDSNYVATDSESLQIESLLKRPISRFEDISTQLEQLNEQHTRLQNEQTSLLLSVSKHRALISLVRKLPIDILQEIFIACLPTAHNSVMSKREPPILLTQVCSSWRIVAHATPQLWKSIHIVVPCKTPGFYTIEYPNFESILQQVAHRRSEAVMEWIGRSATCPLDISLIQRENTVLDGFCNKIMDYLIGISERWRNISFSAPHYTLQRMAELPASKVPLLQSLFLDCSVLHSTPSPTFARFDLRSIWLASGVMTAPKLREVSLTQLNEDATRLPINWSQLTNLSLEGISWGGTSPSLSVSGAYKILSSCRNLVTCRLEVCIVAEFEEYTLFEKNSTLISLPFLTKLSIREGASLSVLFTLLHLPSLLTLEFHTAIWPTQDTSTSLLSLLMRSQSMIQHLITDAQFFKQQDFIACLRLCPFLKSLRIRQSHARSYPPPPPPWPQTDIRVCQVDDAFLKMFIPSDSLVDNTNSNSNNQPAIIRIDEDPLSGCLCPNLDTFESSTATAFSETALLQFIKGKNGGGEPGLAKLERLCVTFHLRPLHDINPELEPYIQAGLVANISYPPSPFAGPLSPFDRLRFPLINQPGFWSRY